MSENPHDETLPQSTSRSFDRILSALVALAALGGAGFFAKAGLEIATAPTGAALIQDHAPALLGLPILAAFAIALVCGARALETRSHVEILGLRADGAGATVLSWVIVFAALTIALRALW